MRQCIPLLPLIDQDREAITRRFWSKVDRRSDDECWPWLTGCSSAGYGSFSASGTVCSSSRIAYALGTGEEPGDLRVCHHCDNPPCCNPAHLFLGTDKDNMVDKVAKGRWGGARCGWAKLTEAQARYAKTSPKKGVEVAAELGVSTSTIFAIRSGKIWKSLDQQAAA